MKTKSSFVPKSTDYSFNQGELYIYSRGGTDMAAVLPSERYIVMVVSDTAPSKNSGNFTAVVLTTPSEGVYCEGDYSRTFAKECFKPFFGQVAITSE